MRALTSALPLTVILLATSACVSTTQVAPAAPAAVVQTAPAAPAVDPAAEDRRLTTFLDQAFEEQLARSPQALTSLGRKDQYDRLDNYTEEYRAQGLALAQRQLQQMRAAFRPEL